MISARPSATSDATAAGPAWPSRALPQKSVDFPRAGTSIPRMWKMLTEQAWRSPRMGLDQAAFVSGLPPRTIRSIIERSTLEVGSKPQGRWHFSFSDVLKLTVVRELAPPLPPSFAGEVAAAAEPLVFDMLRALPQPDAATLTNMLPPPEIELLRLAVTWTDDEVSVAPFDSEATPRTLIILPVGKMISEVWDRVLASMFGAPRPDDDE